MYFTHLLSSGPFNWIIMLHFVEGVHLWKGVGINPDDRTEEFGGASLFLGRRVSESLAV